MFPRVVVFDLDGTWWCPDMYELWGGGGAPFRRIPTTDSAMLDKGKNTVQLLDGTMRLVSELWHWQQFHNTVGGGSGNTNTKRKSGGSGSGGEVPYLIAAASTCDEPQWAQELLRLFHTRPYPFDKQVLITNTGLPKGVDPKTTICINDGASYGGGGVASFSQVLGDYDDVYKGNKRTHMANILQRAKQNKVRFTSNVGAASSSSTSASGAESPAPIYIPPLFAAALPAGTSVCPETGLVSFTDPKTESQLRARLMEEDAEPISYKDFIFFDNQTNNIHDVGRAGICSVYVPEGMTMNNWAKGLQQWRKEQRPFSPNKL